MTGEPRPSWADLSLPDLERLTDSADKRAHYLIDPSLAEGWASLRLLLGEQGAYDFANQTALMWMRPDLMAAWTHGCGSPADCGGGLRAARRDPRTA